MNTARSLWVEILNESRDMRRVDDGAASSRLVALLAVPDCLHARFNVLLRFLKASSGNAQLLVKSVVVLLGCVDALDGSVHCESGDRVGRRGGTGLS